MLPLRLPAQHTGPAPAARSARQPARSTTPKAVVELFTSQGCSSCPAADALLGQLATRDDVIALSLSVDYWDYLGWKDTLAKPKFSERQKAYAKALGDGMVYTPQMVVNGLRPRQRQRRGTRSSGRSTRRRRRLPRRCVPVRMSAADGKLVVEVGAAPQGAAAKEATLWLAVIAKSVEVPITRGENKGKTVTYTNVVRELMPIGMWNGKPMTVQLERHSFMHGRAPSAAPCCVQQGRAGPIVGAALLEALTRSDAHRQNKQRPAQWPAFQVMMCLFLLG